MTKLAITICILISSCASYATDINFSEKASKLLKERSDLISVITEQIKSRPDNIKMQEVRNAWIEYASKIHAVEVISVLVDNIDVYAKWSTTIIIPHDDN